MFDGNYTTVVYNEHSSTGSVALAGGVRTAGAPPQYRVRAASTYACAAPPLPPVSCANSNVAPQRRHYSDGELDTASTAGIVSEPPHPECSHLTIENDSTLQQDCNSVTLPRQHEQTTAAHVNPDSTSLASRFIPASGKNKSRKQSRGTKDGVFHRSLHSLLDSRHSSSEARSGTPPQAENKQRPLKKYSSGGDVGNGSTSHISLFRSPFASLKKRPTMSSDYIKMGKYPVSGLTADNNKQQDVIAINLDGKIPEITITQCTS